MPDILISPIIISKSQCCFDLRPLDLHYKKQCGFLSKILIFKVTFIVNSIINSIVGVGAGVKSQPNNTKVAICKGFETQERF